MNADLKLNFLEETELVAIPSNLFKWVESFNDDKMDQVMDAMIHFDNDFDEEMSIVFAIIGDKPEYFKMNVGRGVIELDDDIEREMFVVDELEKIEVDDFLDNVIAGNQIIKNQELKRILLNYSLL
jgi:hypothetical protein